VWRAGYDLPGVVVREKVAAAVDDKCAALSLRAAVRRGHARLKADAKRVKRGVRSAGLAAVTIKQPFVTMEFHVAASAASLINRQCVPHMLLRPIVMYANANIKISANFCDYVTRCAFFCILTRKIYVAKFIFIFTNSGSRN
jgi:hypothetical protein